MSGFSYGSAAPRIGRTSGGLIGNAMRKPTATRVATATQAPVRKVAAVRRKR